MSKAERTLARSTKKEREPSRPVARAPRARGEATRAERRAAKPKAKMAKAARDAAAPRAPKRGASTPAKKAANAGARAAPKHAPSLAEIATARRDAHGATPLETAPRPLRPSLAPSLDWDDGVRLADATDELVDRWVKRGDELLELLALHGAADHEYRADLKQGRFVWIAPDGRVSAEARAEVVCSWSRPTGVIAMAWADPLVRPVGIAPIDGVPAEREDVDEEGAWRVAIQAADARSAEFIYRVPTPHAWYFLALRDLTFDPQHPLFSAGTPVGLVLRGLGDTRRAVLSRSEPSELLRERLESVGRELLSQADYAYRDSDWVARLMRTGRHVMHLAGRLPRPTFSAVAAGRATDDWLDDETVKELSAGLALLEDEWSAFA
jgi:hypothetical protein